MLLLCCCCCCGEGGGERVVRGWWGRRGGVLSALVVYAVGDFLVLGWWLWVGAGLFVVTACCWALAGLGVGVVGVVGGGVVCVGTVSCVSGLCFLF